MKVTTTITSGTLAHGERVQGTSVGVHPDGRRQAFVSHWEGTYDREALDTHDGEEMYHYFIDGHINDIPQDHFGFPTSNITVDIYGYRTNEDGTETSAWSVTDAGQVVCIHDGEHICGKCLEADERAVRALASV